VLGQCLFDLTGADVGAVVDDDLLLAPEEPQVAVVIGVREVAGEPERASLRASRSAASSSSRHVIRSVALSARPSSGMWPSLAELRPVRDRRATARD
jgi:hypothetical protein